VASRRRSAIAFPCESAILNNRRANETTERKSQAEVRQGGVRLSFPLPANERERIAALHALNILDSPPDPAYDEIGELAAQICGCPIGYISFIDDQRLWFKAKYGLPPDFTGCPREIAFCSTTICGAELVTVPDLREDERFSQNPFVTGDPHLQFYCSMPLITGEGHALGTLCVMDFEPRRLEFEQTQSMRRLSRQLLSQLELRRRLIEYDQTIKELDRARAETAAEKARTEELLVNILPASIAEELKKNGKVQPKYTNAATVLFTDFRGFTLLAERTEPAALIGLLDQYFTAFDDIVAQHDLEKLKTVGDAYMAVAGVPVANRRHAIDTCLAALDMQATVVRMKALRDKMRLPSLDLRVGVHSGPVMSGVVGKNKFTFDIWGDAVNTASLMEANGAPGRINVSETVAGHVKTLFELEPRGPVVAKHDRVHEMFFLNRLKPEFSRDADGRTPNQAFAAECNRLLTGFSG
jgi:class 3 adenylate cyclase